MEKVARTDELVEVVVRLPRKAIEETLLSMPSSVKDIAEERLAVARAVLAARRQRAHCFTGVRFNDPSWDMILELYIAFCEDRAIAVSRLCNLSGGSTTTALRNLENLEALGYVARRADLADRRRLLVTMLPGLANRLEHWLDLHIAVTRTGI